MSMTIFLLFLTSALGSATVNSNNFESDPVVLIDDDKNINMIQRRSLETSIAGGETPQNPNDSKYQKIAEDIVYSHLRIKKEDTRNISVNKVTTQVVSGSITRLKFRVFLVNGQSIGCSSELWEQPWKNVKHVTYTCDSMFQNKKLSFISDNNSRPEQERDPANPKYQELARASLKHWFTTNDPKPFNEKDIKDVHVTSVKAQISSKVTNLINFKVVTTDSGTFKCNSKIMETLWDPHNPMTFGFVKCERSDSEDKSVSQLNKNLVPGGEMEHNPDDPKYKQLAGESFREYKKTHLGLLVKVHDYKVTRVTTQVVSGFITRLDFNVISVNGKSFPCHSKIFEQSWRDQKEITVDCQMNAGNSIKLSGGLPGGEFEKDPDKPEYKKLAEESFREYKKKHPGFLGKVQDYRVIKVTTQVTSAYITRLDFNVIPVAGNSISCHSEIFDEFDHKKFTVNCFVIGGNSKLSKFQPAGGLPGGEFEKDPDKPEYKKLAEESFREYKKKHPGFLGKVQDYRVIKVTTQVTSAYITRLDFNVIPVAGNSISCHSEIFDEFNHKKFTVNCFVIGGNSKLSKFQPAGGLPGGEFEKDPDKPEYKKLAEESFREYKKKHPGFLGKVQDYRVIKVTTQVTSAYITRLDFNVIPVAGNSISCHSEIFDEFNHKKFTVNCFVIGGNSKLQFQPAGGLHGGEFEKDPDKPEYKKLAEESFREYRKKHPGFLGKVQDYRVIKVTTQVTSAYITRLDFNVIPVAGNSISCHSEIFDELDHREMTVNCQLHPKKSKLSMSRLNIQGMPGGEEEQDPDDPKYEQLAKESFQKYRKTHIGPLYSVEELRVTRVSTQIVSGWITKLDFDVILAEGSSFSCHSEVWEQPWLHKKDINVKCSRDKNNPNKPQSNRHGIPGGQEEQDPDDPKYKKLAIESFQRYLKSHANRKIHVKELLVTRVTSQVVAGTITRIDFNVYPSRGRIISCHSEIFYDFHKNNFNVKCHLNPYQYGKHLTTN